MQAVPGRMSRRIQRSHPSVVILAEAKVSKWPSGQKNGPPWHWSLGLPHGCGSCVIREECRETLTYLTGWRTERRRVCFLSGWGNQSLGRKSVLPELLHRRNK